MTSIFTFGFNRQSKDNSNSNSNTRSFPDVQNVFKRLDPSRWWPQLRQKQPTDSDTYQWRTLSPDAPPLPFAGIQSTVLRTETGQTNSNLIRDRSAVLGTFLPRSPNKRQRPLFSPFDRTSTRSETRTLYTIVEESDINIPDPLHSVLRVEEELCLEDNCNFNDMLTTKSSDCITHHSSIGSSHSSFEQPEELQQVCAPREEVVPVVELNYQDIKKKFISMINVAINYRQKHLNDTPVETKVVFDHNNNVSQMRMVVNGNVEYLEFSGNPQYIPPEVSINKKYTTEMADVWVLGVSLYRMLAGKYPFEAPNDRRLFDKMLQKDYTIPPSIPPDAKDLIQLMLVPNSGRASLDFIISHPWITSFNDLEPSSPFGHGFRSPSPLDSPSLPKSRSVEFQKPTKKKFGRQRISRLVGFLLRGPNQPPQHPYRDLVNVGRPVWGQNPTNN